MIKSDSLGEYRPPIRYKDDAGVTLETVRSAITEYAANLNIPVALSYDEVKSGGLFNPSTENSLVMYHPQHQDEYFKFCIRVAQQGTWVYVFVDSYGQSKQMKKANYAEGYRKDRKGKDMGYKVASLVGQGITTIGRNKQKFEEEKMYYECVSDLFEEIFS
ncbi:MAG: hypothetical protein RSH79_07990 [Clostridiales bacterium]